jgi:hypothetical protein
MNMTQPEFARFVLSESEGAALCRRLLRTLRRGMAPSDMRTNNPDDYLRAFAAANKAIAHLRRRWTLSITAIQNRMSGHSEIGVLRSEPLKCRAPAGILEFQCRRGVDSGADATPHHAAAEGVGTGSEGDRGNTLSVLRKWDDPFVAK